MNIREYKTEDREQLEALIAQLQDYEAGFIEGMRAGKEMASQDLDHLLKQCNEKQGKIYLAEEEGEIVGFICSLLEKQSTDIMYYEPFSIFVEIEELMVLEKYRGRGIARSLIDKADDYAKENSLKKVKLNVLAKNILAREIYKKLGFEEDEIILVKKM